MTENSEEEVVFSRRGAVGHIKLNRPHILNALNYDMVIAIQDRLEDWSKDPDVALILVQ